MSRLVAHRGQNSSYPENTIESIQAAINCGATAVEFDVQMTADHVPIICHDVTLLKTAGVDIDITKKNYADVKDINVGEPTRFDNKYPDIFLPSLQNMVSKLKESPHVLVFVELKDESIDVFGIDLMLEYVLIQLKPIQDQCVVIADNLQLLLTLRKHSPIPIGWIIHHWDNEKIILAKNHQLEYLVINHQYCPIEEHDFSSDSWQWVIYETCDANKASELFARGVQYVESDDICSLLEQLPDYK